jgi:hypothetical protein
VLHDGSLFVFKDVPFGRVHNRRDGAFKEGWKERVRETEVTTVRPGADRVKLFFLRFPIFAVMFECLSIVTYRKKIMDNKMS